MPDESATPSVERRLVDVPGGALEVFLVGDVNAGGSVVGAAHPAGVFGASAAELLWHTAGTSAVCVNPRGIGGSTPARSESGEGLESMVDDLDAVRRSLGLSAWTFWGMSGGGWLGLEYASRYPRALDALILESVCACFRARLADPACILSPFHPSWRPALEAQGLLDVASHQDPPGNPDATEWIDVAGVGAVFRRRGGPALLVSPMPVSVEMRAAMPALWPLDYRERLARIRTPTLVIAGSADPIAPLPHVRALHEGIAVSRFLAVEGGGHVPTTARGAEVTQAVRSFLRDAARR
jgi:pimeloyl-ACP methyl ester carboxylesterase